MSVFALSRAEKRLPGCGEGLRDEAALGQADESGDRMQVSAAEVEPSCSFDGLESGVDSDASVVSTLRESNKDESRLGCAAATHLEPLLRAGGLKMFGADCICAIRDALGER